MLTQLMLAWALRLSQDDKFLIWRHKVFCSQDARLLPKFLQSVDWTTSQHVKEALDLVCEWAQYQAGEEVRECTARRVDP